MSGAIRDGRRNACGARLRGGGAVLILASESTAAMFIDDATASMALRDADLERVHFENVPDLAALCGRLHRSDADVAAVVIDPELAAPDELAALSVALELQRARHELRVVLYASPSPSAMHAVRRVVACMACELVVRGVDPMPAWLVHGRSSATLPAHPKEALEQLTRLPARFRIAWIRSVAGTSAPNVKRVAASASVQRRTLERVHRDSGAWTPARLMRALVIAAQQRAPLQVQGAVNKSVRDASE